jgi:hypothetical protein
MFYNAHDGFEKDFKRLSKKWSTLGKGIEAAKKLLATQFDATNPIEVIAPGKIHRITNNQFFAIWKVEIAVPDSGLRPNQWPRMWFAISGDTITQLLLVSHIDNYSDNECDQIAMSRYSELV